MKPKKKTCVVKETRGQLSALTARSTKSSVHVCRFQSERTTGALPWPCPDTNVPAWSFPFIITPNWEFILSSPSKHVGQNMKGKAECVHTMMRNSHRTHLTRVFYSHFTHSFSMLVSMVATRSPTDRAPNTKSPIKRTFPQCLWM